MTRATTLERRSLELLGTIPSLGDPESVITPVRRVGRDGFPKIVGNRTEIDPKMEPKNMKTVSFGVAMAPYGPITAPYES